MRIAVTWLPVFSASCEQRAVVIQAGHRGEVARVEILRIGARDQRVRVRGIAHDEDLHVAIGHFVQGLALRGEDLRVGEQQVLALHAGAARAGTDEQADVQVAESHLRVIRRHDLVERSGTRNRSAPSRRR